MSARRRAVGDARAYDWRRSIGALLLGLLVIVAFDGSFDASASAQAAPRRTVRCGFMDGEQNRYGHRRLLPRTVRTIVGMYGQLGTWSAGQYAVGGAFAGATTALMIPINGHSADERFQSFVYEMPGRSTLLRVFPHLTTVPVTAGFIVYFGGLALTGYLTHRRPIIEYTSLLLEALGTYHLSEITTKLILGRASPYQEAEGRVHGPGHVFYPGGTPSGHTASVYLALEVAAEYWDSVPLKILTHVAGLYMATSLVLHDAHFLSDTVAGAAMGYFVGRWVVRHRSSRFRCIEPPAYRPVDWTAVPMPVTGGAGIMLMGRF